MEIKYTLDDTQVRRAFAIAPKAMIKHQQFALSRAAAEVARTARGKAPKAFSTLTQAIKSALINNSTAHVTAGVDYARYVEEGTEKGGRPPIGDLREWMRIKGVRPRDPEMTQQNLAFLIADKIMRHGTPAQPFMRPALDEKRSRVMDLLRQGVASGMKEAGLL